MSNIVLLNSDNEPLNYKRLVFAGGEVHVNVGGLHEDDLTIVASIRSSDDLMEVMLLKDALSRNCCEYTNLRLTYLPYARQDRVCTVGDAFSLRVVTQMINSCKFYGITVDDCHSPVGIGLLRHDFGEVTNYTQLQQLIDSEYLFDVDAVIVAPDKGALKKSQAIAKYFGLPCVSASKVRDPSTGALTGFALDATADDITGKAVYVFDDICDGGGTFLGLGKLIQELKPKSMNLYLTNGIFSNPANLVALKEMYTVEATYNWVD